MKNLTIKKVALGLILAGFATSSAYAALSATTQNTIKGNAPTITSKATGGTDGKYAYVVERGGTDISTLTGDAKKARAGDVVKISFVYNDADGDAADPDWLNTSKTEKLVLAVSDGTSVGTITQVAPTTDGTTGTYTFTIPDTAAGKGLTIDLYPISEYGDPYVGTRIQGPLFAAANGDGTPPDDCIANPGACIVDKDKGLIVRIYKTGDTTTIYGSSDSGEQTAVAATVIPKIGDTFNYTVTDTLAATTALQDVTAAYKGKWSYTGTATAALSTKSADTAVFSPETVGQAYTIGPNASDVLTLASSTAYDAGAQGFNLKVDVQLN